MQRRSDERGEVLLDALLDGRSAPGLAARASAVLGVPEQGRYAVVVLRGGPAGQVMDADGLRLFRGRGRTASLSSSPWVTAIRPGSPRCWRGGARVVRAGSARWRRAWRGSGRRAGWPRWRC